MHRFYAERTQEGYALSPEDGDHALRVLRLSEGDEVEILAEGRRYRAALSVRGERVFARLTQPLPDTEARLQVTLLQGLPKGDKMDLIVRMATELGAAAVQPVLMRRSVSRPEKKDGERRRTRWEKIAREAVKQCGRVRPPEIGEILPLTSLTQTLRGLDLLLVPWEEAAVGAPVRDLLSAAMREEARCVGLLIGPEGGIDPAEIEWLFAHANAKTVSLGPRILRTETAGAAALTLVMGFAGELG